MSLAIFDLDNTLIAGDSDHCWGEFLVEQGVIDAVTFKQANDRFYEDYQQGTLDIYQYQEFSLKAISHYTVDQLKALHREFMEKKIQRMILPKAQNLIANHRSQSDRLLIITATNHFVAAPIAARLGITELLATDPRVVNGHFTGEIIGTPCFQEGKVKRLKHWLKTQKIDLTESTFYSDSHNDLPLLQIVTHPVAVDPDEKLRHLAARRGWKIISLR